MSLNLHRAYSRTWHVLTTAFCFAALAVSAVSGPVQAGTSYTLIPPGQTFLVGGEQRKPLAVDGVNTGTVAVEVLRGRDGTQTPVKTVAAGERFSAEFAAGETAMLRNTSSNQQARLTLQVGNLMSLSMRYTDNPR
jgi:hypothetical protein